MNVTKELNDSIDDGSLWSEEDEIVEEGYIAYQVMCDNVGVSAMSFKDWKELNKPVLEQPPSLNTAQDLQSKVDQSVKDWDSLSEKFLKQEEQLILTQDLLASAKEYIKVLTDELNEKERELSEVRANHKLATIPALVALYPHYYVRVPNATHVDVNWVLEAWNTGHTIGHAVKKLLCSGKRGAKDRKQDLLEAINSIKRAIELDETK